MDPNELLKENEELKRKNALLQRKVMEYERHLDEFEQEAIQKLFTTYSKRFAMQSYIKAKELAMEMIENVDIKALLKDYIDSIPDPMSIEESENIKEDPETS